MTSKSLSEQLADLTNPVPTLCDPEDDIYEETRARVSEREAALSSGEEEGPAPSRLRRQAAALLSEQDARYAGKAVSRMSLQADSDCDASQEEADGSAADEDSEEESADEEEESADEEEEQQLEAFRAKLNGVAAGSNGLSVSDEAETDSEEAATTPHGSSAADSASGDDSEDGEDGAADENGVEGGEDATDEDDEEASEDGMSEEAGGLQFTSQSGASDTEKGASVQAQLGIWDQLLECRIKLQPCLQLCNQLPAAASWQPFWAAAGDDTAAQLSAATAAADKLAQQLLHLQAALLSQFPETSRLEAAPPSDKRSEAADHDDDAEPPAPASPRKRRRPQGDLSAGEQAAKRFAAYRPYRDTTIQRWNDKTRLTAGRASGAGKAAGFAAFEQSTLRQIEQILSDRERLVRRTRLRRSDALPLGRPTAPAPAADGDNDTELPQAPTSAEDKDYDEEVFDDSDFYHQLLRELIERKTVDVTDPLSLGKQWIQIQKLRSKMKKRVDTRASKGRKVRYEVYPKLVSFMASRRVPGAMSDAARDELFSSLFGQRSRPEVAAAAGADAA